MATFTAMVIEYVRYRIPSQHSDAFLAAYRDAAKALEQSSFCEHYELARCVEEPERYILRLHWTSQTDHLSGFRKSPEFRDFLSAVRPYIENIEEMQHYEPTDITTQS